MTLTIAFWGLYIIGILFGGIFVDRAKPYWFGIPLLNAILFAILGWQVFGPPIHHA